MVLSFFLLPLFFNLSSASEITTENGFRFEVSETSPREVRPLNTAESDDRRLLQLEDQVFIKYQGLKTLCSDAAHSHRDLTTQKCIKALETVLADSNKEWHLLGGLYLNVSADVPAPLQDLANPRRDIFGYSWLPYDFTSSQVDAAIANGRTQINQEVNFTTLLSSLVGRKIEFRCLDTTENCQEMLYALAELPPNSLVALKERTWISVIQIWNKLGDVPRLAPNGTFSEYQLNIASRDDLNLEFF